MTVSGAAGAASSLSLRGLEFSYRRGATPAVAGIDLDVDAGQMLTLLGPSGCGKTTTLRMIAGLLHPTGGKILIDDEDVTDRPVHDRGMGMVFQDYALFPHLTVGQNVSFGLEMRRTPTAERKTRVADALERVGLGGYSDRAVNALSGGQQQRVALARALAVEPTILLLDEPLSNLDATLRSSLRDEIRAQQLRTGTTSVFVTHDQQEALAVSDRIAVMRAGHVEQWGTPDEIFNRPTTRFVASFIGQTNVLDGAVRSLENQIASIEVPGVGVVQGISESKSLAARQNVSLAVHPHRVRLQPVDEANSSGVRGRVDTQVFTGTVVQTSVVVGDVAIRTEQFTGHDQWRPGVGDDVALAWETPDAWVITE